MTVFGLLLPHLDERQQRLTLGAAARVLGHGGIRRVARAAGVAESTVSRGKRELERRGGVCGSGPGAGRGAEVLAGGGSGAGARVAGAGRARPAGRPGISAAVDGEVHPESGGRADSAGAPGRLGHGGLTVEGGGVLPAGHIEDHRGGPASGQGRPVPLHQRSGHGIPRRRAAGHQRGRQEEGDAGQLRGHRTRVAPRRAAGAGPRARLPREGRPEGGAVRDLRHRRGRRLGVGGLRRGHLRLRGGHLAPLVER